MEAATLGSVRVFARWGARRHFVKCSHHGGTWQRWQPLARIIWERHNGPIPEGHQVYHADGDPLNDHPQNLVLGKSNRFKLTFEARSDAARNQRNKRAAAVAKSNRDRARVAGSQVNPRKWYLVLPQSKAVVWWPCRTRRAATKLDHDAVAELCRRDPLVILERRDRLATRSSGAELFVPGHPVEVVQGAALLSGGGVDSRYEGFVRLIPDERPSRRLVVHWGDLEPIPPDEYPAPVEMSLMEP